MYTVNGIPQYEVEDRIVFNPENKKILAHGVVMNWCRDNKAFWALEVINSAQTTQKVKDEKVQVWRFIYDGEKHKVNATCSDENSEKVLFKRTVNDTDLYSNLCVICYLTGDSYDEDKKEFINEKRIICFPQDKE